jgi:hypothetical protein
MKWATSVPIPLSQLSSHSKIHIMAIVKEGKDQSLEMPWDESRMEGTGLNDATRHCTLHITVGNSLT